MNKNELAKAEVLELLGGDVKPEIVFPNPHPDAQWFPKAGLGLFMHWGIHSVAGIQPSWAMIKDYPYGGDTRYQPKEKYFALAQYFNPINYNPDKWMEAASKAGFSYAVLTTKHLDGYALWPSHFGDFNPGTYLGGADLVQPYVDACRKYGMKVGFYFSPQDWYYEGYPLGDVDFDFNKRGQYPERVKDTERNRKEFVKFFEYSLGQIRELLTRYGKIDLLWFDGAGWPGIADLRTNQMYAWIRRLQPGIVINDRWEITIDPLASSEFKDYTWDHIGDYATPECGLPEEIPNTWWELCDIWSEGGHWGYDAGEKLKPMSWFFNYLAQCRAGGGNFLCNIGPRADGTMPDMFYTACKELEAWMLHSAESVKDVQPLTGKVKCNVPVTANGRDYYLHIFRYDIEEVVFHTALKPRSVLLLRTGQPVNYSNDEDTIQIKLDEKDRTGMNDVIKISF